MNKKNGFTLVELLAVIVILAIILVIAVPQIISTITESRKGALASSAKLIASSAETMKLSNDTLGITDEISCEDVSNYNAEDYTCSLEFVDGKAQVTLEGKGKFEGMYVCSGTKENAEATEEACTGDSGGVIEASAVEKIESLATESNTEGLELTSDGNIRYTGASPKNYIKFNDEDWRIIGIFNMTTASGTTEKLMKIVRDSEFSTIMSWDSSASSVNGGHGVNEWSEADLMTMLNTYYIGESTICSYCDKSGQGTCSKDCSSSVTPIGSTYSEMVEEVVWNTGGYAWNDNGISVLTAYNAERGTTTGKICTSGTYCNDTVERKTTWQGKVGLIYPSDYGYASTDTSCRANINDIGNYSCMNTNWLHSNSIYWTISPGAYSSNAINAWSVDAGYVRVYSVNGGNGVRPSVYLKSNVSITIGDGASSATAYQISMN